MDPLNDFPELGSGISATGRLFRILRDAVLRDKNQSFLDAWAQVFGIDSANRTRVYQLLGDLFGLLELSKVEIKAHTELKRSLYLATVEGISTILLGANHHAQWREVATQLEGPNLRALEFCADQLDRLSMEREIPSDYLAELQAEIERVVNTVLQSELEREAKEVLAAKLEDVRTSLLAYRLRGLDGIRAATQSAVGALVMAYPKVATKTPGLRVVHDLLDVLVKLATLAEKANLLMPGSGAAVRALLSGPSGAA